MIPDQGRSKLSRQSRFRRCYLVTVSLDYPPINTGRSGEYGVFCFRNVRPTARPMTRAKSATITIPRTINTFRRR